MDKKIPDLDVYELETVPRFKLEHLSKRDREEIARKNEEFLDSTIRIDVVPKVDHACFYCTSAGRTVDIGRLSNTIHDHDVGIIVTAEAGLWKNLMAIVTRCKVCGHVEIMSTDLAPVANLILRGVQLVERARVASTPEGKPKIMLEDMETGERRDAAPLLNVISGSKGVAFGKVGGNDG